MSLLEKFINKVADKGPDTPMGHPQALVDAQPNAYAAQAAISHEAEQTLSERDQVTREQLGVVASEGAVVAVGNPAEVTQQPAEQQPPVDQNQRAA